MNEPGTPAELKVAFLSTLTAAQRADPVMLAAIDDLIDKIELVYCGEHELTPVELLFGRDLLEAWIQNESIWND